MTTCTIEHWRDGDCVETWAVTPGMIQKADNVARIIFPAGQIVLASFDELHFCIPDGLHVLNEVQLR